MAWKWACTTVSSSEHETAKQMALQTGLETVWNSVPVTVLHWDAEKAFHLVLTMV